MKKISSFKRRSPYKRPEGWIHSGVDYLTGKKENPCRRRRRK